MILFPSFFIFRKLGESNRKVQQRQRQELLRLGGQGRGGQAQAQPSHRQGPDRQQQPLQPQCCQAAPDVDAPQRRAGRVRCSAPAACPGIWGSVAPAEVECTVSVLLLSAPAARATACMTERPGGMSSHAVVPACPPRSTSLPTGPSVRCSCSSDRNLRRKATRAACSGPPSALGHSWDLGLIHLYCNDVYTVADISLFNF